MFYCWPIGSLQDIVGMIDACAWRAFILSPRLRSLGLAAMPAGARKAACTTLAACALAFAPAPTQAAPQVSTGTAFAVTEHGDLVTNEHVVARCGSVEARLGSRSLAATVKASDQQDDLAILHVEHTGERAALRSSPRLRVGEQAITYGFPLAGTLTGEGNLTIGYVSALRGVSDNPNYIQVTTPIQPGNSGGALVDASGHVIGVVAGKINAMRVMQVLGDVPQNINFAISLDVLARFLRKNGIAVAEAASEAELRPADVGDQVRAFTYAIRCTSGDNTAIVAPPAAGPRSAKTVRIAPPPGEHRVEVEAAYLYEEDGGDGRIFVGTVVWRTGSITADAGPDRDKTIRASVRIPGRLNLSLTLRRNLNKQIAAGHIVDVITSSDPPAGGVQTVPGILVKDGPDEHGTPLIGRPVKQAPGLFAVHLSADSADMSRNLDLLQQRARMAIALVYNDGRRAILVVKKGQSGERVVSDVFADWAKAEGAAAAGLAAPPGK
jgi:S1-C subfamily serine protease